METEIKMLSDIHKNADMGQDTLRHILDATKDAEFSKTVSRQMQEYEKAFQVSGQMLKARNAPEEQKEAPMISKWMAHMNINRKSMQDMQTSKLAEMLFTAWYSRSMDKLNAVKMERIQKCWILQKNS